MNKIISFLKVNYNGVKNILNKLNITPEVKALIFVFFVVFASFSAYRIGVNKHVSDLNQVLAEKSDTITYYKDRNNHEVARRIAAETSAKLIARWYPERVDSIKKEYGIRLKNLQSFYKVNSTSQGSADVALTDTTIVIEKPGIPNDTSHVKVFNYYDQWITLSGTVFGDHIKPVWETRESIDLVLHRKRKGLLGPKELLVDARSSNPHSHITNLESINIGSERLKPFGIGVFAGYDPFTGRPTIGVGLNYTFIRF